MGWKVIFSTRSRKDLQRIVEYVACDDPAAAERLGLALIAQAESLSTAPEMGVRLLERPAACFLPFGSYLVIDRPDTPRQTIRILRFWHGARGWRPMR